MDTLDAEINTLLKSSLAPNSWKTYHSALESLNKFRSIYHLPNEWPVPLYDIMSYIAYLSYSGIATSTVTTYISGISHMHKMYNLSDNTESFLVGKMLEGMKRKSAKRPDIRMPISLKLLKKLIASLTHTCHSEYEVNLFASAFSLAFFALLRVGEFTSDKKQESGYHAIRLSNIIIKQHGALEELHITLPSSKTNLQPTTLIVCQQKDIEICPVRLMKKYLKIRSPAQDASESQLFTHFCGTLLTRYQFNSVLQKCLAFCEVQGHFRPHSFRIGGASEAKRLGIAENTIKQWGRWSSQIYQKYIRLIM